MGFAAEIKEFLGAAKDSWKMMSDSELKDAQSKYYGVKTAAEQKEMDDPLNQKLKEAKLADMVARTGQIGRESPLDALRRQQIQLEIDALKTPPKDPVLDTIPSATTSRTSSYPPAPVAKPPEAYGPDYGPLPIKSLFRKGGLVKKFVKGGVVEDEDLEDDEVTSEVTGPAIGPAPVTRSMAPTPAVGTSDATDLSAQRRPAVGGVPLPREKPRELQAVADGLKYGITQLPPNTAAIGMGGGSRARSAALRALAMGAGAAPGSDMLAIYKKIDEDGTMNEGQRNLTALQAVHNYKMRAGDPEGAAKTAFQMLQHFKTVQSRYGALAAAAMKGGHVEEGVKLALKQYHNIPDGNNLKMWVDKESGRIGWSLQTRDGEKTGGVATPEEIGSAAAKLATPGGYENYLTQMVSGAKIGGRGVGAGGGATEAEEPPEALGSKPPKPADYKEIKRESVDKYVDDWNEARQVGPDGKKLSNVKSLDPKELAATKNMLYHIRRNNDVTEDQGLQWVQTILNAPDPVEGERPAFKVIENKENKSRTFITPGGSELVVPNNQLEMFKSARTEAQAQRKKEAADLLEAGKPNKAMQALNKADEYFHQIGTDPATGKTAVQQVGEGLSEAPLPRAVMDAAEWLKNKIPPGPPDSRDHRAPFVANTRENLAAPAPAIAPATARPNTPVPYDPSLEVNAP